MAECQFCKLEVTGSKPVTGSSSVYTIGMSKLPTVYTVYHTLNLVNQKFYIGVHKTHDEYDDYLVVGVLNVPQPTLK